MPKDTFDKVFMEKLAITREVCAMLGKTAAEIAGMDLGEFADLVYSKGYEVTCSAWETPKGREGKLTITADSEPAAVPHNYT